MSVDGLLFENESWLVMWRLYDGLGIRQLGVTQRVISMVVVFVKRLCCMWRNTKLFRKRYLCFLTGIFPSESWPNRKGSGRSRVFEYAEY
jgi:hypothetical protein